MMVEAQEKGHEIFTLSQIVFLILTNLVQNFLLFQLNMKNLAGMKKENNISSLDFFDAILMRQDPPFIWTS